MRRMTGFRGSQSTGEAAIGADAVTYPSAASTVLRRLFARASAGRLKGAPLSVAPPQGGEDTLMQDYSAGARLRSASRSAARDVMPSFG